MLRIVSISLLLWSTTLTINANTYVSDSSAYELNQTIQYLVNNASSNTDTALIIVNESIRIAEFYNDSVHLAELLRLKGLVLFYKVDYKTALDYFTRSRELCNRINYKAGEASALNNISLIYRRQGFVEKALNLDKEVLQMRIEVGDSARIAGSLNNIAVSYGDKKNYDTALNYYMQAVDMSLKIDDIKDLDLYYNNIGNVYMKLGQHEKALPYFEKSLNIAQQFGNKQIYQNALMYIGKYHMVNKNYKKALPLLHKALEIAYEIGIVYEIEDAAKNLNNCYAGLNDYVNAYKYHRLFKTMADSANSIEVAQKIAETEALAEFEKEKKTQKLIQDKKYAEARLIIHREKQRRNVAYIIVFMVLMWLYFLYRNYMRKTRLNKTLIIQHNEILAQKEEIESQRDKIEALNITKDKFFAIIAHDLKNPIGAICQMADLLETNFQSIEKNKQIEYIKHINYSAGRTFSLLENLLQWAMVQTGSIDINRERFSITKLIIENIELLNGNATQKQIDISFEYCDDCFIHADVEMVNTVIRNLLTNAIKFTPKLGSVKLAVADGDTSWVISVKDDGIGISEADQEYLFAAGINKKSIGDSKAKGTGLGLILCKEFIELNKGKIWVESELNKGASFYFSLPKA